MPDIVLIKLVTSFLTGEKTEVQKGESLISSLIHTAVKWQSWNFNLGHFKFSERTTLQVCLHKNRFAE